MNPQNHIMQRIIKTLNEHKNDAVFKMACSASLWLGILDQYTPDENKEEIRTNIANQYKRDISTISLLQQGLPDNGE